jgi:hypothetical protein
MNESKLIAEVYEQKILKENLDPTPGSIAIDEWPSTRDPRVTHKLSYCPNSDKIIDLAFFDGKNLIERKEIDPADIKLYNTWYDDSTLKHLADVLAHSRSAKGPVRSDTPEERSARKARYHAMRLQDQENEYSA